jgi:hypothetical protein
MSVGPRSRYYGQPVVQAPDRKGRIRPTIAIRTTVPPPGPFFRHPISGLQTIEYLSWKGNGQSELWWRIADANDSRFPLDYETGEIVNISADTSAGRISRTR